MAAITIRNIDDALIAAIKRRAGEGGVSMEEEVRRLLASAYADDRQARGKAWARRQLARLKQGKLPRARINSVDEIRSMRRERTAQFERAGGRRNEIRR